MPAISLTPNPRNDRSLALALALLAALGVAEILAVAFHYAGQARAARRVSQPSISAPATVASATPANIAAVPNATPASSVPPIAAAPAAPSSEALSVAERLLKDATALRDRGDTTNALARLQEASQKDPKNAAVLAEMAMIYESIQLFDRSNETWRKIQEIGPSAGPLYELADMKTKMGVPPAAAAGAGMAGVSPLDAGTTRSDSDGIPDGSTFGLTEVTPAENADPDAEKNMTLRIGVKVRPNTIVDHTKVKIQVFFYDTLDDNKVALTDADVSYEWLTPHHDWKETNPEILAVTYLRAKNHTLTGEAAISAAAAAVKPALKKGRGKKGDAESENLPDGAHRKYLGYIVRVYYNDQLQAVRADPTKLLNLFPPPFTAPSQ